MSKGVFTFGHKEDKCAVTHEQQIETKMVGRTLTRFHGKNGNLLEQQEEHKEKLIESFA